MNSSIRSFAFGVLVTMILANAAIRESSEHKEYVQVQGLKTECEKNLPRTEACVIVALPKSKD